MKTINKKSSGRPKKYKEIAYFGLKMTPENKKYLNLLAQKEKKTASSIIIELIQKACKEKNITLENQTKKRITAKELLSLPLEEQEKILREQAKLMSKFYDVIEDNQPLIDY